jgi:acyl-CoA thioester hydrolase
VPTEQPARSAFPHLREMTTRWRDNDVYGHMNNVVYYEYFDTVVNQWLLESGALEIPHGPVVGLVVRTECDYAASLGFPDRIVAGLRAARVGRTSVTYGIGLFRNAEDVAAASGLFTHVYVDAETRRPVPLPEPLRRALEAL